jgi:hypothetical protein
MLESSGLQLKVGAEKTIGIMLSFLSLVAYHPGDSPYGGQLSAMCYCVSSKHL